MHRGVQPRPLDTVAPEGATYMQPCQSGFDTAFMWTRHFSTNRNGAAYYSNSQTGEAQWDPPQQGGYQ